MQKKRLNLNALMMDIKRRLSFYPRASFVIALSFLPFVCISYLGYEKHQRMYIEREALQEAMLRAEKAYSLHMDQAHFIDRYKGANHFYVEEVLETLPLLVTESEMLQAISQDELFDQCELVKRREEKLKSNVMKFAESRRSEDYGLIETESHLLSKVEVDGNDLKHILSLIEGTRVGPFAPRKEAPQLIIKRFSLEKKKGIALLNLEMIKREVHEKI